MPAYCPPAADTEAQASGRIMRHAICPEHPQELATYFCFTCDCFCLCAECIVHQVNKHRNHEVLRLGAAQERVRPQAGVLVDRLVELEDAYVREIDKSNWQQKEVERVAARGRGGLRSAFERVRTQVAEREESLLEALDHFEATALAEVEAQLADHGAQLKDLTALQDAIRTLSRTEQTPVEALNVYVAAKDSVGQLSKAIRQISLKPAQLPDEFNSLNEGNIHERDLHVALSDNWSQFLPGLFAGSPRGGGAPSSPTKHPAAGGGGEAAQRHRQQRR